MKRELVPASTRLRPALYVSSPPPPHPIKINGSTSGTGSQQSTKLCQEPTVV